MTSHTITVQIDEPFEGKTEPAILRQAALATLQNQNISESCELSIVISGDETLRELNERHRKVDTPTDVLAFQNETRGPFVNAPGLPHYLGDVIISFERASAQAEEASHSVRAELQLLVIHGTLHLLGYDDTQPEKRAQMWAAQSDVIDALGISVTVPK